MSNHKVKKCLKCGKEYTPTNNIQKYCEECKIIVKRESWRKWYSKNKEKRNEKTKQYRLEHTEHIKQIQKQYRLEHSEHMKQRNKEYCLEHSKKIKQYYLEHSEDIKQYRLEHKEHTKQYDKEYGKTLNGKIAHKKHQNKRDRNLDFIPLNNFFEGAVAHHLDKTYIIYIPEEVHRSIRHSVLNNINMDKINALAWNYL